MFSLKNLPKLIAGTSGWAMPAPGVQVVACEVPCKVSFPLPASWGGGTKELDVGQNYWITGLAADDIYPNNEFVTFYVLGAQVSPDYDERARLIHAFFAELGHNVSLYLAEKTKPAIVVGVTDEDGEFETKEGPVAFNRNDVFLESPANRGQMWRLLAKDFIKKYDKAGIRSGNIPAEMLT